MTPGLRDAIKWAEGAERRMKNGTGKEHFRKLLDVATRQLLIEEVAAEIRKEADEN